LSKPEKVTTPKVEFIYPKLAVPDTKYNDNGEYSVKFALDEEEAEKLRAHLSEHMDEARELGEERFAALKPAQRKKLGELTINEVGEEEYDDDESLTGRVLFRCKAIASGVSKKTGKPWTRKIRMFDPRGKVLQNVNPWSGTVGRICFKPRAYWSAAVGACGVTFYIETVQILELASGGAGFGDSGFEDEDGYEAIEDGVEETATETDGADSNDTPDDDDGDDNPDF